MVTVPTELLMGRGDRHLIITALPNYIDVSLVSAFFDTRPLALLSHARVVVIAVLESAFVQQVTNSSFPENLLCALATASGSIVWELPAEVREMSENWGTQFRPCFIECIMRAADVRKMVNSSGFNMPETVSIRARMADVVHATSASLLIEKMPNAPFPPRRPRSRACHDSASRDCDPIGVCIAPMRGDMYGDAVGTFFDHYLNLAGGHAHFLLYNLSAGANTSASIREYSTKHPGAIEIVQWQTASGREEGVLNGTWYHGQMLAINDCMLRMAGRARWVGYLDMDEYVVPHCRRAASLAEIFEMTLQSSQLGDGTRPGGFTFLNEFYDEGCRLADGAPVSGSLASLARCRLPSVEPILSRSKVFSDPLAVDEERIHAVHKFLADRRLAQDPETVSAMQAIWNRTADRALGHGYLEYVAVIKEGLGATRVVVPLNVSGMHHIRHIMAARRWSRACPQCDEPYKLNSVECI